MTQCGTSTQGSEGLDVIEDVEVDNISFLHKVVEVVVDEEKTSLVLA